MKKVSHELANLYRQLSEAIPFLVENDPVNALNAIREARRQAACIENYMEREIITHDKAKQKCGNCAMSKCGRMFECAAGHEERMESCPDWQLEGTVQTCDTCAVVARAEKPLCRQHYKSFGMKCPGWTDIKEKISG